MPLVGFVSYQSQDKVSDERLRDELALRGLLVVFDRRAFRWGHRIEGEMQHSVDTCDALVAPVTPHYLYEDRAPDAPRPALDQEFIPAMHRRRAEMAKAKARAQDHPAWSVRPVVVPVGRKLGDLRADAPDRIRRATGEDVSELWLPAVDQDADDLPEQDAATVVLGTLRALLPPSVGASSGTREICVMTRGTGQPAGDLTIDATPLLGGPSNRAGEPADWQRYLAGLRDLQGVLAEHGRARDLRVAINAHITAAVAFGRVFHQATGWRLRVAGRHGDAEPASSRSHPALEESWEQANLTADWLVVELEIVDQPVRSMTNKIIQHASTAPRGRLQLANTKEEDLTPNDISQMANAAAFAIRRIVGQHHPAQLHVVCAAPVEFAVLLGHRLTSLHADIHLYEREGAQYVPTLVIPAQI